MARERRVFTNYPESLRTDQNNRETFVADDPLYEPEKADFLNGFIGSSAELTAEDLSRTPLILDITPERQKYQLSVAATFINPESQRRESYASYTDMIRQIEANGGDVSDPNRVFATEFYAWTPPIDYDKHINFSRYRWVGDGTADVQGEYVTKEPSHSKTVIHQWDGVTLTTHDVEIVVGLPAVGPAGTFIEDASTVERFVYRSNGSAWQLIDIIVSSDVPTNFSGLPTPSYFYVARTGPDFQRPLVWKYSSAAGRWIPQPVVVSPETPETPRNGMVWEDPRLNSERILKVFLNGTFSNLTYTPSDGPPGAPGTDGEYIYDTREYSTLTDPWARENWWRHDEDLSPVDSAERTGTDQAIRPILEFWNGIESISGDTKDFRNDSPVYKKYAIDSSTTEIVDTGESTTIFEYQQGQGSDDPVLGFPLSFNETGEFLFELTLETDPSSFVGYHYFKDVHTGLIHGIWFKSDELTEQEEDADGLFSIPVGISSNPDHEILTTASRSRMLRHMTGVISSQENFEGSVTGLNSYRWTDKNPAVGSTIIDAEKTHLRTLATLQDSDLDLPNAIRAMAKEYNKVLVRFSNKLNQMWDNLILTDGNGSLLVSAAEACDAVLTSQFVGRNEDFPFFFSDMGTFLQTIVEAGIASVIDPNPTPIFVPPSPARVGASPCFSPESFEDRDGNLLLRGHEGSIIPSFGDERDLVWLELQNRFFDVSPNRFCEESDTFSARFAEANFHLSDFFGNYVPLTSIEPVDEIVSDFNAIPSPTDGLRVFSTDTAVFALFSAGSWLTASAQTDDIFLNQDDGEYYIFNGQGTFLIDRWNRPFEFEYTFNEFRNVIRRDFERFIIFREQDFSENTTFDEADPFTWNYKSAGVEGHYKGIYQRVYNTVRPHSHPWEVMGYSIEPDWWRTQYVPDSTSSDGTPRYGSGHTMWTDFAAGIVDHPSGAIQRDQFILAAPVPVDISGELLDPIAAGVVDQSKLDMQRIDDDWIFGDGSPSEQNFLNSTFFPFSVALAGYLMKNGEWMDTLWAETYVGVGDTGSDLIFRAPHVVHSLTLTRPDIGILPVHLERDDDGSIIQRIGVNAWISETVKINGGDPEFDFGRIVRNTSPALSWKTGGYINRARTVISTLAREEIPFSDIHVLLHKSQPIDTTFSSGVLVTREDPSGYRVFGYDPFDPFFTIETPAIPIVGGQVLLEQEFDVVFIDDGEENITGGSVFPNQTLQRTFVVTDFRLPSKITSSDTATLGVLVNGQKFKRQHFTINNSDNSITIEDAVELEEGDKVSVQVLTTESTPSTQVRQFNVNNVNFPYFATGSGQFARIEYGRFFETATDVVNFMIGYGRFLTQQGWCFDTLSEGGAPRDWLLGAQRFARWVLEVESPWNSDPQTSVIDPDSFFYSPIQDEVNFISPFGFTSNVETIMNGAFGILNRQAEPIPVDETFVTRVDDKLNIKRSDLTNETTQIFGTRVNLHEAEHVVVFSNTTRFNDVIYDPVSGLAQTTLIVDTYRTLNWEGRIEANGYVIDGGTLLPNFEKQAFDLTRFYDRFRTIDDPLRREEARNLYGFVPANQARENDPTKSLIRRVTSDSSQYMVPIGAADRSRFDYYRGMIQAKGTRRPAFAFARGTSLGRDNFFLHEDWAWKVGPSEFGDTRHEAVQIQVNKGDFRDQVQVVQFSGPIDPTNNTIEIEDFDRNDIGANTQWILPPKKCETNDTCNVEFPISRDTGLIDVENFRYFAKLFDTDTNFTVLDHVHYDPEVDRFDTTARCLVDFENPFDPARYTDGPGADFSDNRSWGEEQVGCTWWRQDRKLFVDYRGLLPNYEDAAKVWGRPLFFKATITRTDDVATITTYDFTDKDRVTPISHGLSLGDEATVTVRKANESGYNAVNITVTATSTTELEYTVDEQPDTPATGDPEVVFGHMDIYEWVESPVLPTEWEEFVEGLDDPTHPNGTPLNVDDPSFVERQVRNQDGSVTTLYYFWVLNSSGDNGKGKQLTSQEISNRLTNPTVLGVPWFSPVDEGHMLVFTDGEMVEDGFGLEILIDQRFLQTHHGFVLVTEGSQFFDVPQPIVDKMADSLGGIDAMGNEVPSPLLSDNEKFGSCFFPIQTVFADRDAAVGVYIDSLNIILKRKNISEVDILTGIFKLEDEFDETTNPNGFWKRAAFIEERVEDEEVFDTVQTIAERDRRESLGFYAPGDIVRVIESGNTDPWDDSEVASNYEYDGSLFIEIGIDNNTVEVNNNIVSDPDRFRGTPSDPNGLFFLIYNVLEKKEQNSLIFSLLYEMKVQHPDPRCDWFFKTSYVSTQVITKTDKSPFIRPDEVTAIRDNLLDTKAFRSKLRGETNTIEVDEIEPFNVNITEFPDQKYTLIFDRLSCNMLDDCGWDSFAWDTRELPCDKWDVQLWDLDDLGRADTYIVETFQGDGGTTFFVTDALFDPTLYDVDVVIRQNGTVVEPAGLETTITKSHTQIFVSFNFALGPTFEFDVVQSQGFYQDADPTFIGTTLEDTLFSPTNSDYMHAVSRVEVPATELRTVVGGDGNTFTTTSGPFIELYLNGVLQERGVDYTIDFNYEDSEFSAIFTVSPIPGDEIAFVFLRGCLDTNDLLGGRPEERIVTEVYDSVNICVINDATPAYAGWDTTPWDVVGWDEAPFDVGRRVFIISVGKQLDIPAGPEAFDTSEDILVTDPFQIIGTNPQTYTIAQFELDKGSGFVAMTEGVEFEFVGTLSNLIRSIVPERQDFISNGVDIIFQTTSGTKIEFVFYNGHLMTEGVNYVLDGTRTEITWIMPGLVAGDVVSATFLPFIESGDTVRYRFNGWPVGPLGKFIVPPLPTALDPIGYDIVQGTFTFDSLPPPSETFMITYTESRKGGLPESILVRMQEIVADILDDHETYDDPNGFNTFRPVGTRIINTTDNRVYEWDGTVWNFGPVPAPGTQFYITRSQQIYEFDGTNYNLLFDVGDAFTKPPVLDFPPFGEGITFGTYAFGSSVDAPAQWPDAYEVMQHPGDCPP